VGFLQGIVNSQVVEAKSLQDGEADVGRLGHKIHPEEAASIADQLWKFLRR
jgi:hypothetical protein